MKDFARSALLYILLALLVITFGSLIIRKHIQLSASGEITVSSDVVVYVNAAKQLLQKESSKQSLKPEAPKHAALVVALLTLNLTSILIEDHHTVNYMIAYLYLLIAWRQRVITKKIVILLTLLTGVLSILISYDVIVPLFGKFSYMIVLSYSLPVLPIGIILLGLVIYCSRFVSGSPKVSYIS